MPPVRRLLVEACSSRVLEFASASSTRFASPSPSSSLYVALASIFPCMQNKCERPYATKATSKKKSSKSKAAQGKRGKGRYGTGELKKNPKMDAALDKFAKILVKAAEPANIKPEKLTREQLQEYEEKAKEYSRNKMRQHRAIQKELNDKIRLKAAACNALPEGFLREHAWMEDRTLFSPKRRMLMNSPPIEGYFEDIMRADEAAVASDVLGKR